MEQKQRSLSTSFNTQSIFPFYFRGDQVFTQKIQLYLQTILQIPKAHNISLPLRHIENQKLQFIEPIAQIQTFDQITRQGFIKNKSSIKQGVFYIYFPSNIRVDQKIYKIYDRNFENFMKDVPKNFRPNFCKYIIWEQGHGEHSIQNQRQKINELLSNCIKINGQKKVQVFTNEISSLLNLEPNHKVLKNLFVIRNKLASVYKQLKLTNNALEQFTSLHNDILYNHRRFLNAISSKQAPSTSQKVKFKSPFIIQDINKILSYFDQRSNYLQITNFCFMRVFECHLEMNQQYEGMKKLKQFLDFIISNLFQNLTSRQEDIAKNLWIIDTFDETNRILKSVSLPPIMNPQKQQETSLLGVSICSQYRNAIERIGVIFYGLNTYVVFPRNLQYELNLCIKSIKGQNLCEKEYPELKITDRQQEVNKILFLSGQPLTQTVSMVLNNFQSYKIIYLRTLQLMQKTLSQSPYKKVSWSMKLSVLKSTIIYFTSKDEKRLSILSLLEQNKTFSYDHRKSVWQKLQIINKVYQLTLCKRYNIKIRVEDLINIILDDSIIHLRQVWLELVKIVSQLLFEYKRGQSQDQQDRLNSIDFGETQNEDQEFSSRKRRRTTIHHKEKKIEVGTIKFISIKDYIVESSDNCQVRDSSCLQLNIQLSNRIISYAMSLIEASTSEDPLIKLNFEIATINGERRLIPFTINQVEDKFIEAQIKAQKVILFKIQKILVDIGDNVTLVYTMPLNHQKIELYEKKKSAINEEEQNFYVNISPQLKINTLKLEETKLESNRPIQQTKGKWRRQSTSSSTSYQNSQQSSLSINKYKIYQKLWTPIKLSFTFQQNEQIQIQNVSIQSQEEIYDKIFLGEKEVNYKKVDQFKVHSDGQNVFPLIFFIKPRDKPQSISSKQQSSTGSITKRYHKQSTSSLLPKSLRNRAHSITQSVTNSHHGSFLQSNTINVKLTVKHDNYTYPVSKCIKYSVRMPFKIQYRYSQEFQEYTIKNMTDQELEILTDDGERFSVSLHEEVKVFSSSVKVCLKYAGSVDESQSQIESEEGQGFNLMRKLKLDESIDLTKMIKKEHLKPQKLSTIQLDLQKPLANQTQKVRPYCLFQPIRLISEETGFISVLKWNSNEYELVGKIQGNIEYIDEEQKVLEIFLIPTKKGNISLPQISINSKKGIWKCGKRIKIS